MELKKETKMFEQDEKKERKEKEEEMQRSYGKRSDTPRYRGGGNRNNKFTNTSGGSNIQKKKGKLIFFFRNFRGSLHWVLIPGPSVTRLTLYH